MTDEAPRSRALALAVLVGAATLLTVTLAQLTVPSAPLFGGLCAGMVVALGVPGGLELPPIGFRFAQAVIGVVVASQLDYGALLGLREDLPAVLVVCCATLLLSVAIGQLLVLHGVSRTTAAFASIAGGASGVTALASDHGADDRIVVVVQYLRVLAILVTLPAALPLLFDAHVVQPTAGSEAGKSVTGFAMVAVGATAGSILGRVLRLPSPALLGSIVAASALLQLPALDQAQVPPLVAAAAFLVLGAQAGLRFTPESARALVRMLPMAVVVVLTLIGGCGLLGWWLSLQTGETTVDCYLATSPGGLPVVLATTSSVSGDVTFVSAVQVLRLLIVLFMVPVVARSLSRRRR